MFFRSEIKRRQMPKKAMEKDYVSDITHCFFINIFWQGVGDFTYEWILLGSDKRGSVEPFTAAKNNRDFSGQSKF